MDILDALILRELGFRPFTGWAHRPRGSKASDVAKSLGKNVRLVQDRITRMEKEGVIAGRPFMLLAQGMKTPEPQARRGSPERTVG